MTLTTWLLIIVMNTSSNAGVSINVPDLESYAECVRVEKVVRDGPIGQEYKFGRWTSQCIEVHNK